MKTITINYPRELTEKERHLYLSIIFYLQVVSFSLHEGLMAKLFKQTLKNKVKSLLNDLVHEETTKFDVLDEVNSEVTDINFSIRTKIAQELSTLGLIETQDVLDIIIEYKKGNVNFIDKKHE